MSDDLKKPKKRGRPKGPCSPAELAQRRGAAWKHGSRASTALRQTVHPCRDDLCPLGDREACTMKDAVEARGGAMETCLPRLKLDPHIEAAYRQALVDGDDQALRALVVQSVAGLHGLHFQELAQVVTEGLAIEEDLYGKDGDLLGTRKVANPRAYSLLELGKQLGLTADQQAITPKSRGETQRDVSVSKTLDHVRRLRQMENAS